jgi:hypothetical protein
MTFQFAETGGLKGAFVPHAKPKFSDSLWFAGDFQNKYEQYINDTIGFHQDLIRLRNQIDYSFFKKCHSYDIEEGKNGYLVATWHLDAHLGKTRARENRVDSVVMMLEELNDTLSKLNKTLFVMFAPSRGAFYKELAPSWYDTTQTHESDYQRYVRLLSKTSVKFIDYNKSFLQKKKTSKYSLFTKCGIHWSSYGAVLAADSMVKFIEKARGIDLPDLKINKIELSTTARGADADLNSTLNLIWPVRNDTMAYPQVTFNKAAKDKVKALIVGDSFFYGIMECNVMSEAFEEYSFWFYNSSITTNGPNFGKNAKQLNLAEEIKKHDVIGIISTEATLGNLGAGFIDQAWSMYCTSNGAKIQNYIDKIKNDPVWFEQVKAKAAQYNKDLNVQLQQDATWMMEQEQKK